MTTESERMIYDPPSPRKTPASGRREPADGFDGGPAAESSLAPGPIAGETPGAGAVRGDAVAGGEPPGGLCPPLAGDAPGPYGRLAKKLSSRTTDLLAVALISIAALAVGRQLSTWWNTDSADLANPLAGLPTSQPGWAGGSVLLELGDSPVAIRRETFEGNGEGAIEQLVSIGLADIDPAVSAAAPERPLEPAERKMLAYLETLPPLATTAGGGRVHFVPVPIPMTVASRDFSAARVSSGGLGGDNEGSDTGRRIVSWGLAMRQGEAAWTLFSFRATAPAAEGPGAVAVDLPPNSRRTLALRGSAGERVEAFEGSGPAASWAGFFDATAERRGWRVTGDWRVAGDAWTRGFEAGDSKHMQRSRVDVQFGRDDRGGFSGLISVVPLPEEKAKR